jgi:hypothetical protein
MSTNKTLFQEAIADAKAVREAALANAKAALEETMTPRLQSMLAARLEENYDELEEEDGFTPHDTADEQGQSGFGAKEQGRPGYGDAMEEDLDLEEILAELENENQLEEGKKEKTDDEGDEEITEVPKDVDEFVEFVTDLIHQEMEKMKEKSSEEPSIVSSEEPSGDEMPEEPSEEEMPEEEEDKEKMDEEFNLEELLAELDEMYKEDGANEKSKMNEASIAGISLTDWWNMLHPLAIIASISIGGYSLMKNDAKKAIIKDLENQGKPLPDKETLDNLAAAMVGPALDRVTGNKKNESEINEAIRTVKTLRSELNEVNLLNAKLIYVNKIFKSKSLTEAQKIQVITSFDKATTTKEAKVVFESLTTALAATKKPIKESLGFASRAAGIAPGKQQIIESNDAVARMQKLANIIK